MVLLERAPQENTPLPTLMNNTPNTKTMSSWPTSIPTSWGTTSLGDNEPGDDDDPMHTLSPIIAKLGWLPHLKCADVEAWNHTNFLPEWRKDWVPRQYTATWQFSPSGVPGPMFSTGRLGTYAMKSHDLPLFSDIRKLAIKIVTQAELHLVSFTCAITSTPFTIIGVDDFDFTWNNVRPKTPDPPLLDPRMVLVNREDSCGFSVQCHKLADKANDSDFFVKHQVIVARTYLSLSNREMNRRRKVHTPMLQTSHASQAVQLTKPHNSSTLNAIRNVQWTYHHKLVWAVDVEFATVRAQPVPFCVAT
jgi:hypothetical protein